MSSDSNIELKHSCGSVSITYYFSSLFMVPCLFKCLVIFVIDIVYEKKMCIYINLILGMMIVSFKEDFYLFLTLVFRASLIQVQALSFFWATK